MVSVILHPSYVSFSTCISSRWESRSKMGSVGHSSVIEKTTQLNKKIPYYAKDFKNEWCYIIGINKSCGGNDIKFSVKLREYIEGIIKKEKNIIYDYLLSLVSFAIKYFLNPSKDNLKIVDWYFIDLMLKKDKIIIRGLFYDIGLFIEDKVLVEGILELESRINEMDVSD